MDTDIIETPINLQLFRGFFSNKIVLGVPSQGNNVNVLSSNTGNGKETWKIVPVGDAKDNLWNIIVERSNNNRRLLSVSPTGQTVDVFDDDDGSGRQQWQFHRVPLVGVSAFNIVVGGGTPSDRTFLSGRTDNANITLANNDDGSGRQRWLVVQNLVA